MDNVGKREMTLDDTIELMKSHEFDDRFKAEYYQLLIRINRLEKLLWRYLNDPECPSFKCGYDLLSTQARIMRQYLSILKGRAKIENIEL